MTCRVGPGFIVCGDFGRGAYRRRPGKCYGACETEAARVVIRESNPWYSPDWYCADCGDSWTAEGRYPRPFERGWRKKAIAKHEAMWERATEGPIEYDENGYAIPDGATP